MDVLMLSRLQFAAATFFHFLFVPLTLGLSLLIAVMETVYVKKGDEKYKRMAKFWGRIFIINFAIGVVTGITLEFQFGTNWSRYSQYVGDIFGSLLAVEATLAFFLESTFIAVWIFGWDRISPKLHATAIWLVAIASTVSAYWILAANSFMQHPVGYAIRNGRAELTDFVSVVTQKWALLEFLHTVSGAYLLAGFFVMGVSAWHILRKNQVEFFTKSFSIAAAFALIFSVFVAVNGDMSGQEVAQKQPSKLAAMESHWVTQKNAPLYLLVWPDQENGGNLIEALPIPGALSFLGFHDFDAEVKGLNDIPKEDHPPVLLTFLGFRLMVGLGALFILLSAWAWLKRKDPSQSPLLLKILPWAIPLPYIAMQAGWVLAEVGRQPWIVWGLMRTSDAVSPVAASQVGVSLVAFIAIYGLLGAAAFYLIFKHARKGPEPLAASKVNSSEGKEAAHA
ncbi:cytochrome ubiquinol oxidase subunit I [Dethiosulfatarculus sandiegensis]|uniref:Cytochrome D ubiquinol oxidase subunit I n=1 Tax=Dethiosulfatarculus sandiegensis TaxID=1429043 RepID=A0A0D2GCE8_9BACT|nr:cytochrome ubiquinol oxidase subunit I [Dethiosulfatarculus sandiegensis]KIX12567.1 cytochrome D ubiquinol oxidase subunit I [Dethiosulfatarculus sandiegensis]